MASKPTDPIPSSDEPVALADYRPVAGQRTRHDGWTAERQRIFLTVLAETGCILRGVRPGGRLVALRLPAAPARRCLRGRAVGQVSGG